MLQGEGDDQLGQVGENWTWTDQVNENWTC